MGNKLDNLGRLVHDGSGIVVGIRAQGLDTFMPAVLAQSGIASSITGTLAQTVFASITIPGGILGANGALRIVPTLSMTNNANIKSLAIKLGGTLLVGVDYASVLTGQLTAFIRSAGAANAQKAYYTSAASSTAALRLGAVDTSLNQILTIEGNVTNAADTFTLEGYTVEFIPAP